MAQIADLYHPEDLDDAGRTRELASSDLAALRTIAGWIRRVVTRPHRELGREGPVCPFVPEALERKVLWLAPEHIAGRSAADVVRLMKAYRTRFQRMPPIDGDGATYKSLMVVFTDLPVDRVTELFDEVLAQLAVASYVEDGLVLGGFHEGNEGTAIHNPDFRPFKSPAPFLLLRNAVITDWKFFLDNDDWLNRWAHRYGEAGVRALAGELRRMPWRSRGGGAPSQEARRPAPTDAVGSAMTVAASPRR